MAQRTFVFEQPNWRRASAANVRLALLLGGSLLWLLLYVGLGRHMWSTGLRLHNPVDLWLTGATIVLGVVLLLGWLRLWPVLRLRWQTRPGKSPWPPLALAQLQDLSPSDFEAYVAYRVFARQGYQVVNTADVKDGGVDIRLVDAMGNSAIAQCKRYASTVGVSTVRDLYGTMIHDGARYAYLVTSGPISADAREWAQDKPIGLIDGNMVVELSQAEADPTYLQSHYRPLPYQ